MATEVGNQEGAQEEQDYGFAASEALGLLAESESASGAAAGEPFSPENEEEPAESSEAETPSGSPSDTNDESGKPDKETPDQKGEEAEAEAGEEQHPDEGAVPAAKYESMMGRLRQAQDRIKHLEGQVYGLADGANEAESAGSIKDIPEDLAEELALFRKQYPELAPLILEDSADGEKLRSRLEEFGTSYAADQASALQRDRAAVTLQRQRQQQYQQMQADEQREHSQKLEQLHPDFCAAMRDPAKAEKTLKDLDTWIETLPYGQAVEMIRRKGEGSADEVSEMLEQFYHHRASLAKDESDANEQHKKAEAQKAAEEAAAAAVPSRPESSAPGKRRVQKDDYEGAVYEALFSQS